jgi:hypothetical protein
MKNLKIYIFLFVALVVAACDGFVEVDLPDSLLTGPQVYQDPATVRAAMADIYSKLRDDGILCGMGSGGGASLGLYADELISYNSGGTDYIYANALLPTNPTVSNFWNRGYHQIYCANAVIEGVAASASLNPQQKAAFRGEALFVRALVHFYLVNIYGAVPYVSTTDSQTNKNIARMEIASVYEHITADLLLAQSLLPAAYTTAERTVPNASAAAALLARVYLYNSKWPEAADAASAVINNPDYGIESSPALVFLKNSKTTIWQLKPPAEGLNTYEAGAYVFDSAPPPSVSLSTGLINAFEAGDLRKENWVRKIQDGSTDYYHAYKYKQKNSTETSEEYSIVLRLSEQYLIRAEARAQQGDLIGALQDLDAVRHAAGLGDSAAQGQNAVLEAVAHERQVELFTEFGHRFLDLKRTGKTSLLQSVKPGWNPEDTFWPLPEAELLANPALAPQNPGY